MIIELELDSSSDIKTESDITITPGQTLTIYELNNLIPQMEFETNYRIIKIK